MNAQVPKNGAASNQDMVFRKAKTDLQAKLIINEPGDIYEQEADAMAEQVMRMSSPESKGGHMTGLIGASVQRKCSACYSGIQASSSLVSSLNASKGSGTPLPSGTRQFMENAFSTDFSSVRVHTGSLASEMNKGINAKAFTNGSDIYFREGQYNFNTNSSKYLLAHELTHVVQQANDIQTKKIQRALVNVSGQSITINYDNIIYITDYLTGALSLITTFTGVVPTPSMVSRVTALTTSEQRWLLFALDLLIDNTTATHAALNRFDAVDRLINFVPSSTTQPIGGNIASAQLFAREVLIFSGWTDVALTAGLTAPDAVSQAIITPIISPPATGGSSPGPLVVSVLNSRLIPALTTLLTSIDPALRTTVRRQAMPDIQTISDLILAEARTFFSPYADASRANVFNLNPSWTASTNISDTTTTIPTQADRINYLLNRANIVGWNATVSASIPDSNIFADASFDGTRLIDQTELLNIVTTMEADPAIQPIVDRLIQHTGFKTGSGATTHIGIDPEFDASRVTECQARWRLIDTLCHEVLHALVHPDFQSASARISFGQVVREGFTEVLGNQLFNDHIIPKAAVDISFKASMELGLTSATCPVPAAGTIGYGSAGAGAETIRSTMGDSNFRAAYFLGRPDLVGI